MTVLTLTEQAPADLGVGVTFGDQPHDVALGGSQSTPSRSAAVDAHPVRGGRRRRHRRVPARCRRPSMPLRRPGPSRHARCRRARSKRSACIGEAGDAGVGVEPLRGGEQAERPLRARRGPRPGRRSSPARPQPRPGRHSRPGPPNSSWARLPCLVEARLPPLGKARRGRATTDPAGTGAVGRVDRARHALPVRLRSSVPAALAQCDMIPSSHSPTTRPNRLPPPRPIGDRISVAVARAVSRSPDA